MNKILTLEDAVKRIDELEEKIKTNYISVIKKFGDKYSNEELEKEDLESLETIMDACSRFGVISDVGEEGTVIIPISNKMDKDVKLPNKRFDFSKTFADVAEDFNMGSITGK